MSEQIEGRLNMRFIGFLPDGKLMKRAPGSYVQNQIYLKAFRHSKYPWWELVEPVPEVKAPPPKKEDSVFITEEVEPIVEEETAQIVEEMPAWMDFPPIETLTKKELVEYIKSVGGEAKMSMLKKDLIKLASAKGYRSI